MTVAIAAMRQKLRASARTDNEFLAPALEILETPMSPVRSAFIYVICALFACTLAWAYVGRIDVIATGQGKIQPNGRVKVIEPLDTGKVAQILALNGAHVEAGQPLIELDPAEARSDQRAASEGFIAAKAEAARRRAALTAVENHQIDTPPDVAWEADTPLGLRAREQRVLNADLSQLTGALQSLIAQRQQKESERDQLKKTLASQNELIATLQERVAMRQKLIASGAGSRALVIDATELLQTQQTQLGVITGQLASAESGIAVFGRDAEKAIDAFVSDNAQKMDDAERKAEDLQQALAKANAKLEHLTLNAPITGVVQASTVTNIGQVLSAGQEVMRIVPDAAGIEVEAYISNEDIGFVHLGQEAAIKLASFPFTRYGTIKAKVTRIARDAIPEPDASAREGDPSHASASSGFAGAQRMQNLVFAVTLEPETDSIAADGERVPLSSGMATTVEIKTGSRRMLEYVFSPLVEIGATALRER